MNIIELPFHILRDLLVFIFTGRGYLREDQDAWRRFIRDYPQAVAAAEALDLMTPEIQADYEMRMLRHWFVLLVRDRNQYRRDVQNRTQWIRRRVRPALDA